MQLRTCQAVEGKWPELAPVPRASAQCCYDPGMGASPDHLGAESTPSKASVQGCCVACVPPTPVTPGTTVHSGNSSLAGAEPGAGPLATVTWGCSERELPSLGRPGPACSECSARTSQGLSPVWLVRVDVQRRGVSSRLFAFMESQTGAASPRPPGGRDSLGTSGGWDPVRDPFLARLSILATPLLD